MSDDELTVARLGPDASGHNTLNIKTIEVFMQRFAGMIADTDAGIEGMSYQVFNNGEMVQSGVTEADGRILVRMLNGAAELRLMFNNICVARYTINDRQEPLEADTEIAGVQRRLRALGYQLGHAGDGSDGIDGDLGWKTDKAILDFQIDNNLAFDGVVGRRTRSALNDVVGGSAES